MLVAQPRRLSSDGAEDAVDRTDAPQQMAHISAPYNNNIAAIVDALVRLYRR